MYQRIMKLDLPAKQSAFLWGARKTGKSTYLKSTFHESIYYDLLQTDLSFRLMKEPHILREEILALIPDRKNKIIIIDEIQKIPTLLDEVHWLIENTEYQFILCGSSARKLKRQGVNLLGGRAWKYHLFPLVFPEITDFDLLNVFRNGCLPSHYHAHSIDKTLSSYIEDYVTLEIQAEGLVRNLPAFARFIDSLRFSHGELINYTNIASDCGVDSKTVKEYFQILIDTLIGYYVFPFYKRAKRQVISDRPKFYLFDVGLANKIMKKSIADLKGSDAARSLEHYIFLEMTAYKYLNDKEFEINYWRTKTGLEVDFILDEGKIAIAVKIMNDIDKKDIKGLIAFSEEYQTEKNIVVSLVPRARKMSLPHGVVDILPLKQFLEQLWNHKII